MKIYSYYSTVPSHDVEGELRLVNLWCDHWTALGFEPQVLNEWTARKHPYFHEFNNAVMQLPTVNSKEYEVACYHRWLAMAQIGGGIMSDYDVLARKPKELTDMIINRCTKPLNILQAHNCCPSMVVGTADGFLEQCHRFAEYQLRPADKQGDRIHVSDMYILERRAIEEPDSLNVIDAVRCYGDKGFEDVPAVHFSNSSMQPKGLIPRWKHIPGLLPNNNPKT